MTLKQALKKKNKLAADIAMHWARVKRFNSLPEGSVRHYEPAESMVLAVGLTRELAELKEKIHNANGPIAGKIALLAELKSSIARLKKVDTFEGVKNERYSDEKGSKFDVVLSVVTIDGQVQLFEDEIEQIQDDLDHFNAITKI